jgi:hypothetical protein
MRSKAHWVLPRGFELFATCLLLSQDSPGASALRTDTPTQVAERNGSRRRREKGCKEANPPGPLAGVNDRGLALAWTGGGYFPLVPPAAGVPTYVLIAEVLRLSTVEEALAYLGGAQRAGSFLFFLGDAAGARAVVDAVPGRLAVDRSGPALCRANHFTDPGVLAAGGQVKPRRGKTTTLQRGERMAALLEKHRGRVTPGAVQAMLTDRGTAWPWLHQFPGGRQARTLDGMTIDSFFAACQDRAFWTCRGGRTPGPWQVVVP